MSGAGEVLPATAEGWRALLSRYPDVVLVANSDAVDIAALGRSFGRETLFVFFNKTYKVLETRFERPALLVARSSPAGANIVYRREVEAVTAPFDASTFLGIVNLRTAEKERFSSAKDFGGRPTGFLDLAEPMSDFYPSGYVATSGFALAVWLAEGRTGNGIHLAGFTARRSEKWKLFRDHDWTFEQTALRTLHRAGGLTLLGVERVQTPLQRFAARFPEVSLADLERQEGIVLADRLAGVEGAVDTLISRTRIQARLQGFFRSLKPPTRKARLAKGGAEESEAANALAKSSGSD